MARAMIDESRLSRLEAEIGTEALGAVIEAFLEEASTAVADLRALAGGRSPHLIGERLHFLKGCARSVGALHLGELCETLEGRGSRPSGADIGAIEAEFAAVRAELAGRGGGAPR